MYNPKVIDLFNEYLNDNFDSFKFGDLEYCADEILYKFNQERYYQELKRYIDYHNMFVAHGDIWDEYGYVLDPQPEIEF